MSQQKYMLFRNALYVEATRIHTSNFVIKKIKGRMISNEQNVENESFKVGFTLLKKIQKKFKLKMKLTDTKI